MRAPHYRDMGVIYPPEVVGPDRTDPILSRSRWTVAGPAAFATVTRADAIRLIETEQLRVEVQELLCWIRASRPTVDGLMMYVLDGDQVVGFAELIVEDD